MGGAAFGTRLFGKVDAIPGTCYVSTLCWHFCYLPVLPRRSYVILNEQHQRLASSFEGIEIGFSWKSWLVAWVRVVVAVPTLIGVLATFGLAFAATNPRTEIHWGEVIVVGAIVACMAAAWVGSYYVPGIGRATIARRQTLLLVVENIPATDRRTTRTHVV